MGQSYHSESILLLIFGLGLVVPVPALFGHHGLNGISGGFVAVSQVVGVTLDDIVDLPDFVIQIFELVLRASALQLILNLIEGGEVLEVLDACGDVDHRGRQLRVLEAHPLVLVAHSREVLLDLVQSAPFWQVLVPHESHFLQPLAEVLLVLFELLDPAGVAGLQFFEGVGGESLGFEFLDDLIGVDYSRDLFQLPEGLFVIVQLLALVIFIVFVAVAKDRTWFGVVCAALSFWKRFSVCGHVFVDLFFLFADVFGSHFLDGHPALLEVLQLCEGCLLGVGGIMGKEQKFLKIVLFSLEAGLNACQLAIVTHSFLSQPLDDLLVSLLDGLSLIELYHHLVQPIFQQSDGATHRVLLEKSQLILLHLLQLVLEGEQHALPYSSFMLFLVQRDPEVILVIGGESDFGGVKSGPGEHAFALLAGHEIIPQAFQFLILIFQLLDLFAIFLLDLFRLSEEGSSILLQHLVFLVLVVHF